MPPPWSLALLVERCWERLLDQEGFEEVLTALGVYLVLLMVTAATKGLWHLQAFLMAALLTAVLWRMMSSEIAGLTIGADYSGLGAGRGSNQRIGQFVVRLLGSLLSICVGVAFLFNLSWLLAACFIAGYMAL